MTQQLIGDDDNGATLKSWILSSFETQHLSESCSTWVPEQRRDVGVHSEVWNLPHGCTHLLFGTIWFECGWRWSPFWSVPCVEQLSHWSTVRKAVFCLTSCCCFLVCDEHHMVTTVVDMLHVCTQSCTHTMSMHAAVSCLSGWCSGLFQPVMKGQRASVCHKLF